MKMLPFAPAGVSPPPQYIAVSSSLVPSDFFEYQWKKRKNITAVLSMDV